MPKAASKEVQISNAGFVAAQPLSTVGCGDPGPADGHGGVIVRGGDHGEGVGCFLSRCCVGEACPIAPHATLLSSLSEDRRAKALRPRSAKTSLRGPGSPAVSAVARRMG